MRALFAAILALLAADALAGEHRFLSPNGEFEAYTIAANDDGTGMKLFLHRANSRAAGVLLKQNNRSIDAKWSPDSRFLAVVDHLDGHISDVYVFGVGTADAAPMLLYDTPDLHK
jgi:Tol biopolymer transport system component